MSSRRVRRSLVVVDLSVHAYGSPQSVVRRRPRQIPLQAHNIVQDLPPPTLPRLRRVQPHDRPVRFAPRRLQVQTFAGPPRARLRTRYRRVRVRVRLQSVLPGREQVARPPRRPSPPRSGPHRVPSPRGEGPSRARLEIRDPDIIHTVHNKQTIPSHPSGRQTDTRRAIRLHPCRSPSGSLTAP